MDVVNINEISLKEYVDIRIKAVGEQLASNRELSESKFQQSQIAIDKSEEAQQLRNEAQNEWRQESKDRQANFPSKEELQSLRNEVNSVTSRHSDDIKALQLSQATLAGKASQQSVNIAFLLSAIGLILSLYKTFVG